MAKWASIGISIAAVIIGGVLIYFKSNQPVVPESKESTLGVSTTNNSPKESFMELDTPQVSPTNTPVPSPIEPSKQQEKGPYPMEINTKKTYEATLTTTKGTIVVQLFADKTPITVNNFVALSRKKFYNNTIFHRVINGFMIQGGDPKGNGTGGPGYTFADEPFDGEYTRGTIAMANAGLNTNGSQFFIMHADNGLPKNYVIFGRVTKGIEVVDAIATAPTKPQGEGSTPVNPVTITSVEILEK